MHVRTETLGGDTETGAVGLPAVTVELFLEAGLVVAALRALDDPSELERVLRRTVAHVASLRGR